MPESARVMRAGFPWLERRFTCLAMALVAGVVAGAGQAPLSFWPGGLFGLAAALFLFGQSRTPKSAAAVGWAFGTGYFAATLFWIVEPFLIDIARHGWMAPFALLFLSAGLALFWGAAFGAARWLRPAGGAFAWAIALTGVEITRGYILTGFPWSNIGYIWTGSPVLQASAFIGPYGLTLLTLGFVAAFLSAATSKRRWAMLPAVAAAGIGVYGFCAWREAQPVPGPSGPVLRVVQPNAEQRLKWDPDMAAIFFERQLRLTAEAGSPRPELVIWPESAIPYLLRDAERALEAIDLAAGPAEVVLGINRLRGARAYNSLIAVSPTGEVRDVYDKHHLVPFGEYMPAPWLLSRLGLSTFTASRGFGFSPGPGPQVMDFGPFGSALPLICYEAIFPQDTRTPGIRPDWVLQITNDAWFGTLTGPYQHLAQARARAVELGLPLIRSANTGVSAVIDARGRIVDSLPLGTVGKINAALPPALPPTPYSRTGDLPLALALLASLAALAAVRRRETD